MERQVRDVAIGSSVQQGVVLINRELNGGGGDSSSGVGGEDQVIRWERFLPRRILRVLLVENDDSTRHIVAALLRKCSYQVAAVADGLKAWNVLKERHYNFDLVLTEVVTPSLSGIGLLSKIMSNDICKNIPVIMMSSHDSIGIVFKCMLKGAADFLVKPVRKNELRNLWQHVWRKYCSTNCGDGAENGNSNNSKPEAASNDEAASNRGSSNTGNRLTEDSSEGSDSQSSCSRPEVQSESVQKQGEPLQTDHRSFPEATDSRLGKYDDSMAKVSTSIHDKGKAQDNSTDIEIKLTLSIHKAVSAGNVRKESDTEVRSPYWEDGPDLVRSKKGRHIDPKTLDQDDEMHVPSKEVIDFIKTATTEKGSSRLEENDTEEYIVHESAKSSDASRTVCHSGSLPLWELSLRSKFEGQDKEAFQEKHVLKHSEGSAFSRYVNAGGDVSCPRSSLSSSYIKTNECGTSNGQMYSSNDNDRRAPFPLIERPTPSHVYGGEASIQCQLSSRRNKEDADPSSSFPSREDASVGGSPAGKAVSHHLQFGVAPVSIPVGAIPFQSLCSSYGAILQPIFYQEPSVSFGGSAEAPNGMVVDPPKSSTDHCNQLNNKPQHLNCHLYYGNHQPHQLMQGMEEQRADVGSIYPRVVLHNPAEKTTIASGSNGNQEDTGVSTNGSTAVESGLDRDRSLREAALIKFRMKRKDRCFEKKVRYHNRQKLAEQRPRLKGQFVRQAVTESNSAVAESDD